MAWGNRRETTLEPVRAASPLRLGYDAGSGVTNTRGFEDRVTGMLGFMGCFEASARTKLAGGALLVGLVLLPLGAAAQGWCGPVNGHGKDYLDPTDRKSLGIVERVHFTPEVRALRSGATGYLVSDLEYVLNHFANHHAALDALSRLVVREGRSQPLRAEWSIECRFQWARTVNPNDAMVPFIQGLHHFRLGKMAQAREYLQESVELEPTNPEVRYNLGLILVKLGEYEQARTHAREAYAMGFPLQGLRNMLERAGYPIAPDLEDEG